MRTLMVGYDLNKPVQHYTELVAKLKTYSKWWHYLDSTWLITTARTALEVRDDLMPFVDANDELLVIEITGDMWASVGFTRTASDWLQANL